MSNSLISKQYKEYAIVDTEPDSGSGGFFTNPISLRTLKVDRAYFSIRKVDQDESTSSDMTVTLQFKGEDDEDWQDYRNDGVLFDIGDRVVINDNAGGVSWRAGVKEDDFTAGSLIFGFDW